MAEAVLKRVSDRLSEARDSIKCLLFLDYMLPDMQNFRMKQSVSSGIPSFFNILDLLFWLVPKG